MVIKYKSLAPLDIMLGGIVGNLIYIFVEVRGHQSKPRASRLAMCSSVSDNNFLLV